MFTGIIDHCGTIIQLERLPHALRATLAGNFIDLVEGESIAVDGVCLTAVAPSAQQFTVDVSPETWQLTTAKDWRVGTLVNFERALKVGDRLGGHWVTGHIDGKGCLAQRSAQAEFIELTFNGLNSAALRYVIQKGSIAINGVSLTINQVLADGFQVMLIPHTLARTNLQQLKLGDWVNLEFDLLVRVIVKQLTEYPLMTQLP